MRVSKRRLLIGLGGLVTLQAGALLTFHWIERRRTAPLLPGFAYEKLTPRALVSATPFESRDGRGVHLSDYGRGPLLLHFWATWCAPCRSELPTLLAAFPSPPAAGSPALLLVSVDENWETLRHYFGGEPPAQVVRDPQGLGTKSVAVDTLPESLLLQPGGILVARVRGARDWTSDEAQEAVATLLGSGSR